MKNSIPYTIYTHDDIPKLTEHQEELLSEWVKIVDFKQLGRKTTACLLTLGNGFEIVGTSACVDLAAFDTDIGNHYALVDALSKLDAFAGFNLQQSRKF